MNKYGTDSLFPSQETDEVVSCSHVIRVAFASAVDNEFDYLVPDKLWPIEAGQRVEVPFGRGNKLKEAFCVAVDENNPDDSKRKFKLKKVIGVADKQPLIDADLMALAKWISGYYVCPLGQVLAAIVPSAVKKKAGVKKQKLIHLADGLDAKAALDQLRGKKQKQIIEYLNDKAAVNSKTSLNLRTVLDQIGCTNAPVKVLAEKLIVKIIQKEVLKSLPVIPEGLTVKTEKVVPNQDQRKALDHITHQINSEKFGVTLLHGVTDSGKTEVYIRAIEAALQVKKSAIVLLPEIALTTQIIQRFNSRFKKIAVMHSGLTPAQRNVQWQKIKAGQADVVIGARSAVFAPLPRPGLIIVDEEHEPSYKQDTVPRYNARDVAVKRSQLLNAHCILGSATPSLETLANCQTKKHFNIAMLPKRVMDLPMPKMKLVDLREDFLAKKGIQLISEPLKTKLLETIKRKEQAILLLNRRGYSNFVFCPRCKHTLQCRNCDVMLTFHKRKLKSRLQSITGKHLDYGTAMCHYCGAKTLVPEKCPLCSQNMAMIGIGTQRLEEEIAKRLPQIRLARVDSDSMQGKNYYQLLKDFSQGKIDVLLGTQMLAKGLHFPNVTLVGIINADTSLSLPDFRANERTFQLISQVSGRTGRSEKKGIVFVQTFLPQQQAIQFAVAGDYNGFVQEELKHRKACNLPPFWRLALVVMRDRNFDKLQLACKAMRERIDAAVEQNKLNVTVRGPVTPGISRIQHFHRMQIIVQAPNAAIIQQLFNKLRSAAPIQPAVKVAIDIDPVNLL